MRRSFSIIELLVTMAIIGLLMVTILPALSKFGRNNGVSLAVQTVRETLADVQTMAASPDPTLCPFAAVAAPKTINVYVLFISDGVVTIPRFDPADASQKYQCGITISNVPPALGNNQYAILAGSIDATTNTFYTVGIVRTGTLDDPAQFAGPIVGGADRVVFFGFRSPNGGLYLSPNAAYNYISQYNAGANKQQVYSSSSSTGVYRATGTDLTGQFAYIGIKSPDASYHQTVFINTTTGQVTSTGKAPSGYVP